MCLAIPILVEQLLADDMARVTLNGVSKHVSIALLEDVHIGDYLLIHVGYALARLDPEEAALTLAMMREAGATMALEDGRGAAMKHIDEYRNGALARDIAARIAQDAVPGRHYQFMEFCGRPHPRHFALRHRRSAASQRPAGTWPRLPGLRVAGWPDR